MLSEIRVWDTKLSTYWIVMLIGFLSMIGLTLHRRKMYKLRSWQAACFATILMLVGLMGCKLLYVLENLSYVRENGFSAGGFSFFGAVFLIPPIMAVFGKLFALSPRNSVNACAPCVVLILAVMRVGCFLSGCCGGWTTANGFTWPTQAIESIGDFMILFWLLNREPEGDRLLYSEFMLLYGVLRFVVEFLRDTPKDWLYLSHGQWFAIVSVLMATVLLWRERTRKKESSNCDEIDEYERAQRNKKGGA